uniref:Uncharacterized protein n=1 Tax=Cacopsylla melanoneura TaxID=428564 RepID=A0A8D8VZ10_9HEMI
MCINMYNIECTSITTEQQDCKKHCTRLLVEVLSIQKDNYTCHRPEYNTVFSRIYINTSVKTAVASLVSQNYVKQSLVRGISSHEIVSRHGIAICGRFLS